jgi:hypothetical protein
MEAAALRPIETRHGGRVAWPERAGLLAAIPSIIVTIFHAVTLVITAIFTAILTAILSAVTGIFSGYSLIPPAVATILMGIMAVFPVIFTCVVAILTMVLPAFHAPGFCKHEGGVSGYFSAHQSIRGGMGCR